ncbi:MAG: hypothetical protein ORO03_08505, partial [Alphaproteobacteria bacterium]|nr:hypothetical protein [Alphaproteobacteria bacterium]
SYFPPDISQEQKANIELAAKNFELQRTIEFNKAQVEAENALTERISVLEGTASDLKSIPVFGPVMLFIRGSQRPMWGFGTLYIDFQVFSDKWTLVSPEMNSAFWLVNVLVLSFLFGERAVANVLPLVSDILKAKGGK